jgi:hypothetical protein
MFKLKKKEGNIYKHFQNELQKINISELPFDKSRPSNFFFISVSR